MVHRLVDADHRTSVVSANSLASRLGGTAGAVGLGVLAGGAGIPLALAVAAGALAAGAPLYRVAGRQCHQASAGPGSVPGHGRRGS
jgi:hypothetical protein